MIRFRQRLNGHALVRPVHELVMDGPDQLHLLGEILRRLLLLRRVHPAQRQQEFLHLQRIIGQPQRPVIQRLEDRLQLRPGRQHRRVPLGAKPLPQRQRVHPRLRQHRRQLCRQFLRVQRQRNPFIISQRKTQHRMGAAVHRVQGQVPRPQIERHALLHGPPHPPHVAVGQFQSALSGGVVVGEVLALDTHPGQGQARK